MIHISTVDVDISPCKVRLLRSYVRRVFSSYNDHGVLDVLGCYTSFRTTHVDGRPSLLLPSMARFYKRQ